MTRRRRRNPYARLDRLDPEKVKPVSDAIEKSLAPLRDFAVELGRPSAEWEAEAVRAQARAAAEAEAERRWQEWHEDLSREAAENRRLRDAQLRALGYTPLADRRPEKRGAKKLGIPKDTLWWILDKRIEKGKAASREWLARETKRLAERPENEENIEYVPRDRLAPLVDWIIDHPGSAELAAKLREIPPEFSAGELGPIPPEREESA